MIKRWDEVLKRIAGIKRPRVAEVGVWQGKMSAKLLALHKGLELHMIDRWIPPAMTDSYYDSGSEIARREAAEYNKAFHLSVAIASRYPGRAHIIKETTLDAADLYEDGSLDLVFIDADHSYEGVKKDIKAWLPKVKPSGYLSGHDYAHPDQGGVERAVLELFEGADIELGDNRTWFLRL